MKYILDTHAIIWAATEPDQLSETVIEILQNNEHEIYVTNISFWEISIKYGLGKLDLGNHMPDDFPNYCNEMGFLFLPIDPEIVSKSYQLKKHYHKDPFDKLLIYLTLQLDMNLISIDKKIKLYEPDGLKVVW